MRFLFAAAALAVLALSQAALATTLDRVAPEYVKLQLEIGAHEDGYIDSYYGPPEWKAEAEARKRTTAAIRADVDALLARTRAAVIAKPEGRRKPFLVAHLISARTRLDMIDGKRLPFRDEAELILGWRPDLKPLSYYDPILARIDKLVPGKGDLAARVDAFKTRYVIPKDRLDAVMHAAIAECRRRTQAHIALPAAESFTLEFVNNKPWSGYNWYQGGDKSLIQINTDLPIFIDRAVDLGCHEGYPGHHVLNLLHEQRQSVARGWPEASVLPLYGPIGFISEGSANYGIELAFPGDEQLAFERDVLFPLAGLDPNTAKAYDSLRKAMRGLANARITIAADYLDGKIDRETATELTRKYMLVSRKRAEQTMAFNDTYRSYVINYGVGLDAVRAHVEHAGTAADARWKAFETVIAEPTIREMLLEK
ncbi:MAG: hypothetical protein ACXWVJ_04050 [Caulobacteraceae bacterium]